MERVLIVDDNSDILWVVEVVLRRYGYEVMALPRGEDVIPRIKSFAPDLILLDVFLSGIDGIEVCNKLKENSKTKDIPVIMFSAHTNFSDIQKFCKADDFIAKPFDVNELVGKIQNQIKSAHA
ncbi:MAG TPA: response regulator [Chitinophagaceae bacterium]|nr:response regulator [Chitinophagaceae bacterium]